MSKRSAQPHANADLAAFKLRKALREGQVVRVKVKPLVTVLVEGAIENSGPLQIPQGTTLKELIDYLQFKPEADQRPLQKKRRLKEGETIVVPTKEKTIKNKKIKNG